MTPPEYPSNIAQVLHDAQDEGLLLANTLAQVGQKWQQILRAEWIEILDDNGNPFFRTADVPAPRLYYSQPIVFYRETIAILHSSGPITEEHPQFRVLSAELATVVSEIKRWGEAEAERRSEKIRRIMEEGLTETNYRLMQLCSLSPAPWDIMGMVMSRQEPFQHMHHLRRFLLGRIWGYRREFPFIGWIPDGLIAILPRDPQGNGPTLTKKLTQEWMDSCPEWPIVSYCMPCDSAELLPKGLMWISKLMTFGITTQLTGFLNPVVDHHVLGYLIQLPPKTLSDMVQETLGPLLSPVHRDILDALQKYLYHHRSVALAAAALYVHKNTIMYRIHQAEKLLNRNFNSTQETAEVWMALQALSLLEAGWMN